MLQGRRGAEGAKLWIDWPLRIQRHTVDELHSSILESYAAEQIRFVVNRRDVQIGWHSSPSDMIPPGELTKGIESLAFVVNETVWIHLGPRLPYVYSLSTEPPAVAVLWKTRHVLRSARRSFGTMLFRTWGAAISVAVAFIGAAWALGSPANAPAITISTWLISGALALYLVATVITGISRRIIIDIRSPGDSGVVGRWAANTASAILVGVVVALVSAAIWTVIAGGAVLPTP